MKDINWNDAPEWAKGQGITHGENGDRVWYNDTQYTYVKLSGGNYGPFKFSSEGNFLCTLEAHQIVNRIPKPELVDWNEAPAWATKRGALPEFGGYILVWFNDTQYQYDGGAGPYGLKTEETNSYNFTAEEFFWIEERPYVAPVKAWSGYGIPLVGDRCELYLGLNWYEVNVLSYGVSILQSESGASVVTVETLHDGEFLSVLTRNCRFRTLRTREEKEQELFVLRLLGETVSGEMRRDDAEALYKAGLRFV